MNEIQQRLEFAVAIAREAGEFTLKYFRSSGLEVENKGDGSPVTIADKGAEELLRARIGEQFPHDAILGEEFGDKPGTTAFQWVLDPIDGTKSFVQGIPLYTNLVAVLQKPADAPAETPGKAVIGVVNTPAAGEMVYAGVGSGCWYCCGDTEPVPTRVSGVSDMEKAVLLTTDVGRFADARDADSMADYLKLHQEARLARTWGDAYGYLLVATGRAEVMIDPVVSLWDIAPLLPILEEAGGRFTDWQGKATVHSGEAIATNGALHERILTTFEGQ